VADTGVEGVARERDALRLELGACRLDVVDVQRDRVLADPVLYAHPRGIDHAQRQVARLELGEVPVRPVHRSRQAERRPVELDGRLEVAGGQRDEVDAGYE
jgi:hypothetical protein